MKAAIFNIERWYDKRYDGRKKIFRGITKEEFNIVVNTHTMNGIFFIIDGLKQNGQNGVKLYSISLKYHTYTKVMGWMIIIIINGHVVMG